ncbi:hypothetical protein [Candidatus Contendibacter odensensis]|uniref:Uncharacterized protein n=1 Tax=Candidatus Contendobacter odensis Run_B_J11 TaxID=1400861 RepID=A0A7U7GF38_9GAMM|nr:hypothetical protein [Candidatus Contendobacter odensis]CDH47104.1 conserved hypothetical protein [Candidatus Contendobacter odensis Run_B_J11]
MITNELLIEKSQTQKKLDEIANHSLEKYVENTHSKVQQLSAKLGLKLKYGKPAEVLK